MTHSAARAATVANLTDDSGNLTVMDTPAEIRPGPPPADPRRQAPVYLRADRRTHIMLAQLVWTIIGSILLGLGVWWVVHGWGPHGLLYTIPFLVLGVMKGLFILDRTARRTADRIEERGDDRFVFSFYSRRTWLVALGFMLFGQVLRRLPIPRADLGLVYIMVGVGLLLGSRAMWRSWWGYRHRGDAA
jgi:hypothetical protein